MVLNIRRDHSLKGYLEMSEIIVGYHKEEGL